MKCNQSQELIMRYFDHNLSRESRNLLDEHLNGCPECRNLYKDLHRILTPLEIPVPVEPGPGLEKLVLERIQTLPETKPSQDNELARIIYGSLAAALVFLLFIIHWSLQQVSFTQLLLQSRQYFNFLSGIVLNSQIIYRVITSVFGEAASAIFREIQNISQAAVLFGIILIIKFTARKPAGPKPELR